MQKVFQQLTFPRELNFLFLSILLFAIAMGINLVTFPTVLTLHGVDAGRIGIAFTIDTFGGFLMSFFLSRLVSYFTMMRVLKFSSFGYAAIIFLIYFYQNFYLWTALAFMMGSLWFMYVITRQSWMNILVKNNQRGVATGIFSMIISAGVALGPVIVRLTGAAHYLSFAISALLAIASFYCLMPLRKSPQPKLQSERINLREFFQHNPRSFLARFFLDFQTYLLLTFTVVFGVNIGLPSETAGLLISAYMASGFFDVLVGFALKKWNPYQTIKLGFVGCLCCFLTILFFHQSYLLLIAIYFIFGIFIACIFVSVFKICNDDYSKARLVAANSTFQLIGSAGSFFGSLFGGILFNFFGANGFPFAMILSCICYLSFLLIYEKKIN